MPSPVSFFTTTILSILTLPFLLANAQNTFIFPTPASGQSFRDGETINVAWTTNFTAPSLQLYCSYLEKPFVTASISSESMTYALTLAFGPQPNCYLQLSQGVETFGTGIFAITASNTTVSGSSGLGPSATVPSGVVPSGTASNSTVPKGTVSSRPIPSGTLRNGTVPCEVKYPRTQRGY